MEENNKKKPHKIKNLLIGTGFFLLVGGTAVIAKNTYESNNLKYVASSDGSIDVENTIDYDKLKDYKLLKVKTVFEGEKLFIANAKNVPYNGVKYLKYRDIFTNKTVCLTDQEYVSAEDSPTKYIESRGIDSYLIALDEIKEKYTIDDLTDIYGKIISEYEKYESEMDKYIKIKVGE